MKALFYKKPGPLSLTDIDIPKPKNNEILIKIAYSGICGTDIHILSDEIPAANEIIPGHEFSGQVVKCGSEIIGLKKGDNVVVDPNNFCGKCSFCKKGQVHFCENLKPIGIFKNGGWAEYCAVPENQVYKLPENASLVSGALTEPLSCIVHGWNRCQPVSSDSSILILGAGLIGLLWGIFLRHSGYKNFMLSEISNHRRELASQLGFDASFLSENTWPGNKYDIIIDCTGNPDAIEKAFQWINPMGKFLFFGVCPQNSRININPFQIFKNELTIIGSVINPFTFQTAINLQSSLEIPLEHLGIGFFALNEYDKAITSVKKGLISKALFDLSK
ncbi:MAG: zinc-dependent alcohol dehydrogenase family protein [Calditrichaceae bacterium]